MILSKKFPNTEEGMEEMTRYIIESFGDISKYRIAEEDDISAIFLAGAPGAGKSEFMETILSELRDNFIVIDIDMYRNMFRGYDGENSSEYQHCSVRVADKILKYCFHHHLNFILDGTFRSYGKVEQNLHQCEKHNRKVLITLIYQEPRISFYYTFLRKLNKKRNVPVDVFVDGFYDSITNIFRAVRSFRNTSMMIADKKYHDIDGHKFDYTIQNNIKDISGFCRHYNIGYTRGVFVNRKKLKIDIEHFQDILLEQFTGNGSFLGWLKLTWFKIRNKH